VKVLVQTVVRDEEFYIDMELESVVNKAYGIFVLDTGSKDRTVEIVKEYQKKYSNIYLEEKSFGGLFKWELGGYKETDARNYLNKRAREEFPEADWMLILDGDEMVNDDFFSEIDRVSSLGATSMGHATSLPTSTKTVLNTSKDFRTMEDDVRHKVSYCFDGHFRAWDKSHRAEWVYTPGTRNPFQGAFIGNKAVTELHCHFHLHYAMGPKSIYGWLVDWKLTESSVPSVLGIPFEDCYNQKAYEEKFPDWFSNGKFKPKADRLKDLLDKSAPLNTYLPQYAAKRWEAWGDWT
jgi:hypothetical protein